MHPRERIRFRAEALRAAGRWREPAEGPSATAVVDTRSNDYLGLARQVVSRETLDGARSQLGAGASRLVSGTWPEHSAVEQALASWVGAESALLFSSTYAANVGCLAALAGPGEVILSDALNHASIIDGCRLSKADVIVLPHGDCDALERALSNTTGVRWVVTEAYFGMDGDSPDLPRIRRLCDRHEAGLIVDEAHALGIFGPQGGGACAAAGITPDVLIGGLGKAFGLQGGFAACSRELRSWLWNRARSFVFSTAASPHLCSLTLEQLERVRAADAQRDRLRTLEQLLELRLRAAGLPVARGRRGPIFPVVFGDEASVMRAAEQLAGRGVLCQPIRPPTVPPGGSRLRVTVRADMTEAEVALVASTVAEAWLRRDCASSPGRTEAEVAAAPPTGHLKAPLSSRADPELRGSGPTISLMGSVHRARASARRWVVLGTGTAVGKTFVSRGLLSLLRMRGWPCAGLKPIETGVGLQGVYASTDAGALHAASFHVKHPAPHPLYAFPDPVTPALAARNARTVIDISRIRDWVASTEVQSANLPSPDGHAPAGPAHLVIETAGGVFSPVTDIHSNFELARALEPADWILVAPNRLGVLHDVLSCLQAMAALGRPPDWIVLSAPETPDASTSTNAAELRRHPLAAPILELPRDAPACLLPILDSHFSQVAAARAAP
jgi:8-amino-7-oxononanoate synthase